MTLYFPPSMGTKPARVVFSTWTDHWPFGYDLTAALQPRVFVELGTQNGFSYFAFCQSVRDHALEHTRCYAVDTWVGDEHTGDYANHVFEDVRTFNEKHFASFSTLLRMRFEEAVQRFEDESIDLLHIDGLHTYEAVRADFDAWYPKVEPGGVILFHDINARMLDFGAWRFWAELETHFPCFRFDHGFGLGVLRKAGGAVKAVPLLDMLFSPDPDERERLKAYYVHASLFQERVRIGHRRR